MRARWSGLLLSALGCAHGEGTLPSSGGRFPEGVRMLDFEGPPGGPSRDAAELAEALGSTDVDPVRPLTLTTRRADLAAAIVSGRREGIATLQYFALRHDGLWSALVQIGEDAMDRSYSAFVRVDGATTGTFVVDRAEHVYVAIDVTRGVANPNGCGPPDDRAEAFTWLCSVTPELACFGRIDRGPREYDEDNRLPSVQESLGACEDVDPGPAPERQRSPTRDVRVDAGDRLCVVQGAAERCFSVGALYATSRASRPRY